MMSRRPRCIGFDKAGRRCAGYTLDELMLCPRHDAFYRALVEDSTCADTRVQLARLPWETWREGKAIIDDLFKERRAG